MAEYAEYDVLVVGSGPNGLTAAAYLAKAGARVLLLERRHETGGGLLTEEFSGFRFNLHATYMMMMDVMPPYGDLDLLSYGCVYMQPDAQVALLTKEGKALTLFRDVNRSANSIEKFSIKDAKRFTEVWAECKRLSEKCLIPATYASPAPALDLVEMYSQSDTGKAVLATLEKTPLEVVKDWGFENDYLNVLLLYLVCMWGLDPELSGVGFLVPLYMNRMLNAALVKGGSHRLSSAIQKVVLASGGDVLESAEVSKIVVEDGVAKGVELSDGRGFQASAIITSTDPQTTFLKLVGEEACNKASRTLAKMVAAWQWETWSLFGVHLALNEPPQYKAADYDPAVDEALMKIMGYESPDDFLWHIAEIKEGKLTFGGHATTLTDFDPLMAPTDIFPGVATVRWETLAPYDPKQGAWDQVAEQYADEIVAKWKDYAPNLGKARVIRRYVYPPTYIEQKLVNMVKGSFKHGAYESTQLGYYRPNIECSSCATPIKGLYVCGGSTYPGGMVLLGGGYLAAGVVADALGFKRWWTEPDYVKEARERKLVP